MTTSKNLIPTATTVIKRPQLWLFITLMVFITACKKDDQPEPVIEKKLVLNFNSSTIPLNLVDSAIVVFQQQGSLNPMLKRMNKGTNTLTVETDDLKGGQWTATLYLYARTADNTLRRYQHAHSFTISSANSNEQVNGPNGKVADHWEPFIVFSAPDKGIRVTIPMNNSNPTVELSFTDKRWDYFYVERYASNYVDGVKDHVASGGWECDQNCYTHGNMIINSTGFIPLKNDLGSKSWNSGEIFISITDLQNDTVEFSYEYNK
jgi:hypothetical protein